MKRPKVVTLVPYRPAGDRHRWLWDQTLPFLEALGYPVFTGEPHGEEWARAEAVNAAADAAGRWDIALIGDCDTIISPDDVRRAIWWLQDTGLGAIRPHSERVMLSQKGTITFLQRGPEYLVRGDLARQYAGGGLLVVDRDAFEGVGRYDESWRGWGFEDSDFNLRVLRAYGWDRLPGVAYHLWHPTEANKPSKETTLRSRTLRREYRDEINRWAADKGLRDPMGVL